jgi:hypothetical protein
MEILLCRNTQIGQRFRGVESSCCRQIKIPSNRHLPTNPAPSAAQRRRWTKNYLRGLLTGSFGEAETVATLPLGRLTLPGSSELGKLMHSSAPHGAGHADINRNPCEGNAPSHSALPGEKQ